MISLVVDFAMEILEEQSRKTVHTAGITHLLEHPEYHSLDKAKPLMTYLSEESEASKLPVALDGGRNMNILIGPENVNEALKDTSVVMASYDIGDNMRGVIGVVGPTRMDYAKGDRPPVLLRRQPDPDVRQGRASLPARGRGRTQE